MAKIDLPFYSEAKSIHVPEWGTVHLKAFQILVFVTITEQGYSTPPQGAPIMPALFDSGNSFCFTLNEEQLKAATPWNMQLKPLQKVYSFNEFAGISHRAAGWLADAWIYDYTCNNPPPILRKNSPVGDNLLKLSLAQDGIACIDLNQKQVTDTNVKRSGGSKGFFHWLFSSSRNQTDDPSHSLELLPSVNRQRDSRTNRLLLPHLPLLGLRALCLNSLRLEMVCTPMGGNLIIEALTPPVAKI